VGSNPTPGANKHIPLVLESTKALWRNGMPPGGREKIARKEVSMKNKNNDWNVVISELEE